MSTTMQPGTLQQRVYIPYMNLGGGKCTKKDAHAIRRDQLAELINGWYAFGDALSKRPGSVAVVTSSGATGNGGPVKSLYIARFNGVSYILVQQGTALYYAKLSDTVWTPITTPLGAGANPIQCAQMYDPSTGKDTVFICDGVSQPWTWTGPPATTLGSATVPKNAGNTAFITPKYVATLGNNSKLFYAGDPSAPSAVFISDAEYPQSFTTSLTASSWYTGVGTAGAAYYPAIIGQNDGVDGGSITGIAGLGSAMIVYKESAIYRMDETQLLGDTAFRVTTVSSSVGMLSPRSLVKFNNFHTFLGIDGVYICQGVADEDMICVSADVPTYFDNTLTGFSALIQNYTTAVAARMGNRLLLWFDDGSGTPVRGVWFDFNKPNPESGLPTVGEIQGMNMGGCAAQRGPNDDGHLIWGDAGQDRVGHFGIGFSDFSQPITITFFGKADLMDDEFGPDSPLCYKVVDNASALIALPQVQAGEGITILYTLVTDLLSQSPNTGTISASVGAGGGTWGQNWAPSGTNQLVWSSPQAASQYQVASIPTAAVPQTFGRSIQIGFQETSTYPITFLGFILEINKQEPLL